MSVKNKVHGLIINSFKKPPSMDFITKTGQWGKAQQTGIHSATISM